MEQKNSSESPSPGLQSGQKKLHLSQDETGTEAPLGAEESGAEGGIMELGESSQRSTEPLIENNTFTTNVLIGDSKRSFVFVQRDTISLTGTNNPRLRLPPHMSAWTRDDVSTWMKGCLEISEPQAEKFADRVQNGNSLMQYNEENLENSFEFTETEVDKFVTSREAWLSEENKNKDSVFSRVSRTGSADQTVWHFNATYVYNFELNDASDCIVFIEAGTRLQSDDSRSAAVSVNMLIKNPTDSDRQKLTYKVIYKFMKLAAQDISLKGLNEIIKRLEDECGCVVERVERSSIRFIIRFYSQESLDKFRGQCLNGALAEKLTEHLMTDYDIREASRKELKIQMIIKDTDYEEAKSILEHSQSPRPGLQSGQTELSQDVTDVEPDLQQHQAIHQSSSASPNQPQTDVHVHGPAFFGPVTNTTVNLPGLSSPDQVQAVASKAEEAVKNVYINRGSYVQMLPWVDDHKRHIMDIFTKLCLVEQVDTRGEIQHKEIDLYEEIFFFKTREGNPIKRIIVSGSAGIGKTTLIDKIAYDWAMGTCQTLNKFKLVFALKMRSLKQSTELTEAISNQLVAYDSVDQSALKDFIDKNQDKVLILLDGFDEFKFDPLDTSSFGSILNILNRNRGPECWVVITSRPPLDKLVNSSLVEKPYTHVRVEGFSDTDKEEYVNKFFPDHVKASKLTEQIKQSETLSDLAKSPMLLLLMCLLMGSTENTLPDTMTRLYNKALNYIFKRKTRDIKDAAISKILISIGKVALDRLISTDESIAFREGDFEKSALDAAMNAGVLTSEMVIDGLDIYQRMYFMHHTFLEYCAAMYWQSLMNTEEFDRILDQIELIESKFLLTHRYDYLLQFCCGDNEACTNRILQKVHEVIEPRLVAICYLESQPKELPPKHIIRSVLAGEDEDDDVVHLYLSDNELFYFLKCVTTLSRGNDYFTNVKKLVVGRLSFQKFGEDLAKSIKLMTNLQSLSLKDSSLSAANTNQILSSLASPSTLTELDLSGSRALGGSVSLLAPQLMKLKRLKELHLVDCSLQAQDVSPIAESTGDTLVKLNVSENRALGGCASIWGPELGKMECLQDIHLTDCSLQGTDIEPIAVALSGVSTVANLDLSSNYALGGGALLWAQHLKKIRHLKALTLEKSWLKDCDMKPISESVSDMPNLVHLNLSENEALGGCASSWALHLKKMILLEELILKGCNLTDCDVKPIAESLSGKCTLAYLDMSSNYALGGCASSWAQHFKKISHLQKLKLQYVKQEDMEPIAESVSDLPNFTHLDLTHSLSDGHASLWALHLKKMSHLKELILEWCYLQYDDIEPIAESVSDMPNLIYLDLTMNDNLGGGASLWAQHLRKMSHLKELKLERCNLSDEDMEPIAEAVSDMPNLVRLDLSKNRYLHHCASLWAPHLKQMIKHLKELKMYRCLLTEKDHKHIIASIGLNSSIVKTIPNYSQM